MAVIADVGGIYSNSYVTVSEVEQYFQTRSFSESWDSVEDQDKMVVTATNNIDWFINFPGEKTNSDQALMWPRKNVFDTSINEYIASDIIPRKIKLAVFELILASIEEDRTADDELNGISQIQVGSIKLVTEKSRSKPVIPQVVYEILKGILSNSLFGPFSEVVRW